MNLIAPIDKKNKIKIQSSRCDFLSIQDLQQHRNIQTSRSANCVDEPNSNKINSELKLDHLLKTQKKTQRTITLNANGLGCGTNT